MTFPQALRVLMQAAERDVGGCGRGFRSTSDAWRIKVSEAWVIVFRRLNKREPDDNDFFNSGMIKPKGRNEDERGGKP